MKRRLDRLRTALGFAVLLLCADTLGWLYAQHVLDRHLQRLQAEASAAGWRFTAASVARGGWPLAATRRYEDPGLHPAGRPAAFAADGWTGSSLTAAISILHPGEMRIGLGGGQAISTTNSRQAVRQAVRFRGDDITLALPLEGHPGQVRIDAARLRVLAPAALGPAMLRVGHLEGTVRWTGAAVALGVSAQDLELAAGAPGLDADSGALDVSLVGPLRSSGAGWTDRLQAWRDQGGRLIVTRAVLQWPDAGVALAGNAALDTELRSDGAFSLHLVGINALVERSVRAGFASAGQATSIRAILGLIASSTDARQGGSLTLPLDLHAGTLALGRIPLLQLPALVPRPATSSGTMPSP